MRRKLVEVVPTIYGDPHDRRVFFIDVPALVRRVMLPDTEHTRAVLAGRALRQLRRGLNGERLIAKMQGVPRV